MRRFIFIAEILNSSSDEMKEFRKSDRRQLFHRVERNALFDKSSSSSKQLIIKNSFEN